MRRERQPCSTFMDDRRLHRAANMGELDLVRLLLERGAHPGPDAQGHTPRSLAEARGHTEVLEALSRTGA